MVIVQHDRENKLLENRVSIWKSVRQAAGSDEDRALDRCRGCLELEIQPMHPFGLQVAIFNQEAGNHDSPKPVAPDRTGQGSTLGGRTTSRGFHVAILTDGPLEDLTGQVPARHILDFVKVTGGAVVGASIKIGMAGGVNQILIRLRVRGITDFYRVEVESRRKGG